MADDNDMVQVKIHDDVDTDKYDYNEDYKEKSDEEKDVDDLGRMKSSEDDSDGDSEEDGDTAEVLKRIISSMVPVRKRNFLTTQIRSNPDLYGPFWVCATLVVTIAISGNLANYLIHAGDHNWTYDFHKITFAAVAIFCYAWLVPVCIWGVLTWRGNIAGYSFLEILCVYGYSLSIFIPISVLWVIPFELIRWILVIIGMCLSGAVLVLTFWPAVRNDDRKVAWTILVVIFLLHGSLAIGFKLYFFHSPPSVVSQDTKSTPQPMTTTAPSTTSIIITGSKGLSRSNLKLRKQDRSRHSKKT